MTYKQSSLIAATALLALATAGLVAQQEVRITQDVRTVGPGPLGPGGPGGPLAPMARGTGLIFGQAVDAGSTRPVAGALVTINVPGTAPIRALADGQGRFAFRDLPKGRFNLTATKPGYVDGSYGRMRPSGPALTLDLAENEKVANVPISLWKYAAVAGTVLDEQGDPLVNTTVRVLKRSIVGGQWRLTPGAQDLTDDRGSYRIGMLEPGEYVVAVPMSQNTMMLDAPAMPVDGARDVMTFVAVRATAGAAMAGGGEMPIIIEGANAANAGTSEDGRPLAYPTQFYPTAASASRATVVTVSSGEERTNIDFQLKAVRTVKIAGTVMGLEGPVGGIQLTLAPAEASELITPMETLSSFSGDGGAFSFAAVPAGQYTLRASRSPRFAMGGAETITVAQGGGTMITRTMTNTGAGQPPLPTEPTLWTETTVSVGTNDVTDLTISLRPGLRVTGTVQFDGAAARPRPEDLPNIGVTLESADVRPGSTPTARGRVESSGTFATMGVPPGRYFVRVANAPASWTFRGATLGGRDVTDQPVEIDGDLTGVMLTFTDRQTELSGTVTSETGPPDAATVIAFPTDTSAWAGYGSASRRLRTARVDKTGSYSITNLPAGEYFVVAVPERMAADWQNPKFLEGLTADATRLRLPEGDKRTQNVKVAR